MSQVIPFPVLVVVHGRDLPRRVRWEIRARVWWWKLKRAAA